LGLITQIRLEPLILGSQRRNDIRITGSRHSALFTEEFDLTVVSLASQDSQATDLPSSTSEDAPAASRSSQLIHKHLSSVAAAKRRSHPPGLVFRPPAFSLGGMMEKTTL